MSAVATFTKTGSKATTESKLDKDIFGIEITNHELLKKVYMSYLANGRMNLAVVKNRGDVSGGGKKPWKQKGTGRARFGSSRNPIWRGGGVAFGPTGLENYTIKLSLSSKRLATKQALSDAAISGKIIVIESIVLGSTKTSELAKLLKKLGAVKNVIIVAENKTEQLNRASANLGSVIVVQPKYLNVFDITNADFLVFEQSTLKTISDWLGGSK